MVAWLSERPYDLVVIIILLGLIGCTLKRIRDGITNSGVFAAHLFLAFGLTCSLYPVYTYLDPMLGGHNILNLFQRIGIGTCGWLITRELSKIFTVLGKEGKEPRCASVVWLFIIILGLSGSFIGMNAEESSRGLDHYSSKTLYYLLYQAFTMLGFLVGAPYLIPRLKAQSRKISSKYLRLQTQSFLVGYVSSIICLGTYIATWTIPALVPIREIFVYLTVISFVLAFFMAAKERDHQVI